jgi:hypothetical protein
MQIKAIMVENEKIVSQEKERLPPRIFKVK